MKKILNTFILVCAILFFLFISESYPQSSFLYPKESEVFCRDYFRGSEGIAFNGEGRLFVSGDKGFWEIDTLGVAQKLTNLYSHLGIASIGERDLLVADFGPENAFKNGRNNDGIIWRISPEGTKKIEVSGIGDPNFILVKKDGSYLITDDATNEVFLVDKNKKLSLYCTAVNHPNGLALDENEETLYIAQIFNNIKPIVFDNRVWSVEIKDGKPINAANIVVKTGEGGANDGLLMDKKGRLYIAANKEGKIWRFDPKTNEFIVITENVVGVASMAFGQGKFDHNSIYFTTTYSNGQGGKVF